MPIEDEEALHKRQSPEKVNGDKNGYGADAQAAAVPTNGDGQRGGMMAYKKAHWRGQFLLDHVLRIMD